MLLSSLIVAASAYSARTTAMTAAPPATKFAVGFNNSNCEAHPHAGTQLHDKGWLMVLSATRIPASPNLDT
jgi:hypothetical protein